MKFLKQYNSIQGYLERFTIFQIGKLHLRTHTIKSKDATTLLHCHPFKYISVIWKGGYQEQYLTKWGDIGTRDRRAPCIIFSSHKRYNRIEKLHGETKSIFLAWGKYKWNAINKEVDHSDTMHRMLVKGKWVWTKRRSGIWYIGNDDKDIAKDEVRHSIYQDR